MIAYLEGQIIYSDGKEVIIKTRDGVGYQVFLAKILIEKSSVGLFISQIIVAI